MKPLRGKAFEPSSDNCSGRMSGPAGACDRSTADHLTPIVQIGARA